MSDKIGPRKIVTTDSNIYLTILHSHLDQNFDLAKFHTLSCDLKVNFDWERVSGKEKPARIREWLLALERNGRLSERVILAQQYRPYIPRLPVMEKSNMATVFLLAPYAISPPMLIKN